MADATVIVEVINDRDNRFGIEFSVDGTPVNLTSSGVNPTSVSRIIIDYDGTDIDSDVETTAFDWATDGADGIAYFKFGALGLAEGNYSCSAIIYDPVNPNGQEFQDLFQMNVKETKEG